MNKKVVLTLLLTLPFILVVVGCSANKPSTSQITKPLKFTVAADVRNDTVPGVTPQIEQALLKEVQRQNKNLKKIVNSAEISGGSVFLVRTKNGFSTYFVEKSTQKVQFVYGEESAYSESQHNSPGSFSIATIAEQNKEFTKQKVVIGTVNLAEATKASITWHDGHQTTYNLTNGTLIMEPKSNELMLDQWEAFDSSGKSLYKQEVNN